ncbi:MAG TPA: hypothetical protein VJK27_06640 [Terriglobales bacterium]|jgi:hypothetical protein|nr:hypothetical protein [Terriglobales bacterium]
MLLGETIATYDVDLALRGETGKFEVTSPRGETHYVTCKLNESVPKSRSLNEQTYPEAFLVRKIAESVLLEQASPAIPAAEEKTAASDSRAPFLIEHRSAKDTSFSVEDPGTRLAGPEGNAPMVWHLELHYPEGEPASVCLTSGLEGSTNDMRVGLTTPCRTFNDLDSEIRRLHAQLEDIQVRAKKRFYKAQAAAASA